jgi:hypothetical protein
MQDDGLVSDLRINVELPHDGVLAAGKNILNVALWLPLTIMLYRCDALVECDYRTTR